jgi:hypothetical protein
MKLFSWKYQPSGNCPVQAEGTFLGHYFYFRSRWNTASIEFSETEEDWEKCAIIKRIELKHYGGADAGWISHSEGLRLVVIGCLTYIVPRILFALGIIKAREPYVPPIE